MFRAKISANMKNRISKILIANRGEIACRIIRTAKKLGIKTVAVYSDVDKNAINVSMSDEAYCIGSASSLDSYLRQDRIIDVAMNANCEAVHPGYGFLSENAQFAEMCENHKLIFIGPPSSAIRDMGSKSISKEIMLKAGVPVIPGYHGRDQSDETLENQAEAIGFPLMIKAVVGGGGKGMKIVTNKSDFMSQLESARRESMSAFGEQNILLERFITSPRHVEVQVFFDHFGNGIYLFERDCSIQRRHQKVIEEAPAVGLDTKMRESLGTTAVCAGKAVNYVGAGTVEFIYNQSDNTFYFMEMNTRLQVEHAVTEMVTNVDLVEWQIKIANGEKLPCTQSDVILHGHAVEARIYAEDPYLEFLPTAGLVTYLSIPESTNDVRIEIGVHEGDEVSVHYDPMIGKLIVWGETRSEAFAKIEKQLRKFIIIGLSTNVSFLINLCQHPQLLAGNMDTNFIENYKQELLLKRPATTQLLVQVALAKILWEDQEATRQIMESDSPHSPWVLKRGFRVNHFHIRILKFTYNNEEYEIEATYLGFNKYLLQRNGGNKFLVSANISSTSGKSSSSTLIIHCEDTVWKCDFFIEDDYKLHLFNADGVHDFEIQQEQFDPNVLNQKNDDNAVSPMPGIVNKIFVKVGDRVKTGDQLMVIMAMKMEYAIKAPKDGVIKNVLFNNGESVPKNAPVVEIRDT